MKPLPTVFRMESFEDPPHPFPSLAEALRLRPSSCESQVVTSARGVLLAEAAPVCGPGSILQWTLTLAGQDVIDATGWTAGQPELSERESDTVLSVALGDELQVAS